MSHNRSIRLGGLSLSWRVLITGFLLVLGTGYLAGALNAALSVGITPASIADHYGDQTLNQEEKAIMAEQGFVEEEFSFDDEEEMGDMAGMDGMAGMGDMAGMYCHGKGHGGDDGLTAPTSITAQQMAQLAHVHLLGFAMILLSVGSLACLIDLSEGVKTTLVGLLFLSLGGDIGGLYLVRFVSDQFALLNMMAGVTIGLCLAVVSVRALYEMWLQPRADGA